MEVMYDGPKYAFFKAANTIKRRIRLQRGIGTSLREAKYCRESADKNTSKAICTPCGKRDGFENTTRRKIARHLFEMRRGNDCV